MKRSKYSEAQIAFVLKQAEVDSGKRGGVPTDVADKVKALEREVRELRQATEILQGVSVFCTGGARLHVPAMIAFIDDNRDVYGVEPICRVLPIAPSATSRLPKPNSYIMLPRMP